jgi:hypothetical protein
MFSVRFIVGLFHAPFEQDYLVFSFCVQEIAMHTNGQNMCKIDWIGESCGGSTNELRYDCDTEG